ncbi:hypothetical protein [Hippea sp. KM1]|uniref:hypothetical protein n=1 Tax=Hippea sp. KM1 TaxID=944481 RepID=UPI0012ECAE28|nr:hypothetical protein [Hippea sp. KM1]
MEHLLKMFGYFILSFFISYIALRAGMGLTNAIVKPDELELKMQKISYIIIPFLSAILSVYLFFNS